MASVAIARPPGRSGGNRTTALRWQAILTELGHQVRVAEGWDGAPAQVLIALHARRSHDAIAAFRTAHPTAPLVVAATGTDLYEDLAGNGDPSHLARAGFEAADRIVVLQEEALSALPAPLRDRGRIIHQSVQVSPTALPGPRDGGPLQVVLLAQLREVKDPLLVARALEHVPAGVPVRVRHAGSGEDAALVAEATRRTGEDARYEWLGELERPEALALLANSHLALCTSRSEGGANAVGEALTLDVPLLATDVSGNRGLMGRNHPGLFPAGDAQALATELERAALDPTFLQTLRDAGRARAHLLTPERERDAWRDLMADLLDPTPG